MRRVLLVALIAVLALLAVRPALGSTSRPIRAIRCETSYGYRYSRFVSSYTSRAECRWGETMVGLDFGY